LEGAAVSENTQIKPASYCTGISTARPVRALILRPEMGLCLYQNQKGILMWRVNTRKSTAEKIAPLMANMIRDYKSSGISKGDQDISPEGNWI
jgi:hypothetical protein